MLVPDVMQTAFLTSRRIAAVRIGKHGAMKCLRFMAFVDHAADIHGDVLNGIASRFAISSQPRSSDLASGFIVRATA